MKTFVTPSGRTLFSRPDWIGKAYHNAFATYEKPYTVCYACGGVALGESFQTLGDAEKFHETLCDFALALRVRNFDDKQTLGAKAS